MTLSISNNARRLLCAATLALAVTQTVCAQQDDLLLFEAARHNPAVASVLDMPRETSAQTLQAIFMLLDLGQADVAKSLWGDFVGNDFNDDEKATLVKSLGTARFLNLARREATDNLAGARDFAESCLQTAAKRNRDPQKLAALIDNLNNDSDEIRSAARNDLAVTGDQGAVACLEALAGTTDKQLRTELMLTLAKMRPGVEPLLIAALADSQGQFRRDVVELCGYLYLQDSVPWLAALAAGADSDPTVMSAAHAALAKLGLSALSTDDARAVVLNAIHQLETHEHPPTADNLWWSFHADNTKLSSQEVSANEKQLLQIARLSRALDQLPNATPADRRLALIYAFQVAEATQQPLPDHLKQLADSLSVAEISDTLHDALTGNQMSAAIACVRLLAIRADDAALASVNGLRGPLAQSLAHPDHDLKFAALEAVMKISPQRSFAGASGVAPALWQFAAGDGAPQAIAASSVVTRASDWAGQLRGQGYDATPVTTGREALLTALNSPRLELILIDSDIGRPLLREVVYSLRSNPPLARVPIAVLSSLDNLSRAKHVAEQDPWTLSTPRPHGEPAMQDVLARLTALGSSQRSAQQRTEQAAAALNWIAGLLENDHPYDELLRDSHLVAETLHNPNLTDSSLRVLAVLGTADSQQQLINYASSSTLALETRQKAVDAFSKSVEHFGKLLTSNEILRQYDRYNASETADQGTQAVLGKILDILEKQ